MGDQTKKYPDLTSSGRIFPSWIMKNFKKYKLPEVITKEGEDPCDVDLKFELRKYQEFASQYLDYRSPYTNILIYHGLGSGKTVTSINMYNVLYDYTPAWNVYVLIPARLRYDPWMKDLKRWLDKDEYQDRYENIKFVHYDSPLADRDFLNAIRDSDTSKKSFYIIDEAHNFISNVYSNITTRKGKRAQVIYDHILQEQKESESVRIMLLSGTPAINNPFELALMYNLLRPGIFPRSENEFNNLYITSLNYRTLNSSRKNMFQRRIMGLTSYYYGATPDLYASKTIHSVNLEMSPYHELVYENFERYEKMLQQKKRKQRGSSGGDEMYKSYTRQASNFVFPKMTEDMTGDNRPRPGNFRLSTEEAEKVREGKKKLKFSEEKLTDVGQYAAAMDEYVSTFENYIMEKAEEDRKTGHTIEDDLASYLAKYPGRFKKFHRKVEKKSSLYQALYDSSPKMLAIVFTMQASPGPVIIYSNYVRMEGLELLRVYLGVFGYQSRDPNLDPEVKGKYYGEFHGGIKDKQMRDKIRQIYNVSGNKDGSVMKAMLISPSGTEGISLSNVRQIHIMEPYWTEVRMTQIIGRGVRQCSHKDLPMEDRHVDVYRYKLVRKNGLTTTDQYIEEKAKEKDQLIESFLEAMREVSVDCQLFRSHNMMTKEYKCFQFDENTLFSKYIGPAYKEDVRDDMKMDNGSNSIYSVTKRIKVMRVKGRVLLEEDTYDEVQDYWYYAETGVVYDFDMHFPVGRVLLDDNELPVKLDKETYVINDVIEIPSIILRE